MDESSQHEVTSHKEERPHRIQADSVDREKLLEKLSAVIDPLDPSQHPDGLMNVVTGRIAPEDVNVPLAVKLGRKQQNEY